MQHSVRYDVPRMIEDASAKGWLPIDLIRKASVSIAHGYRFFRGESQSPRTAEKLAGALDKRAGDYLIRRSAVTATASVESHDSLPDDQQASLPFRRRKTDPSLSTEEEIGAR